MSGYVGIQTRPDLPSVGGVVTSMTMNFESTRIAIGASSPTTNTGIVKVYDYVGATNTWVQVGQDLVGNGQNAYFGGSMDMDWDGNRMIVGAWGSKTVHVYDYVAATNTWTSTVVISKPSDTEFGFSVSIENDTGTIVAASAPGVNNVYVFQLIAGTWTQVFVNNGNDIENIVPETLTSNLIVKSEYSRYGHSIRLSSFGDYLVIGQPGTILETLTTDNLVNYTGIPISVSSKQEIDGVYSITFGDNLNRQQGSVRVYKSNGSWTTAEQVGSLVRGDIENTIASPTRLEFAFGWSFPGFGMSVDISAEGDFIVVGAPLHSVTGGDYTYHNGQLYTFTNQGGNWVKTDVVTGLKRVMFGSSIKLDYTGNRIAVTGTNKICSLLNVSDWNGNNWFSAQPDIILNIGTIEPNVTHISNGTLVPISRSATTLFYDYLLTQSILGNNLVSGYLAADELFIGANDNDNVETQKFSKTKRISFGGTYLDNTYEGATIENRMYQRFISSADGGQGGPGNEGRSELYIAKTSEQISVSESGGVDFIRLKAHEIHLDAYSIYDDLIFKYKQDPTFVLNYQRNIGIGLPFLLANTGAERYFRGTCDARAKLDVNGSSYIRNRLNVNVSGGNDILGNAGEQPALFLDTRNESSVVGDTMYSNTMVNSRIVNSHITFYGATYSLNERAIFLPSTTVFATAPPPIQGGGSGRRIRLSFWIKLTTAATADGVVIQYGYPGQNDDLANQVTVYTTTTGIKINYAGSYIVSYDYTLELHTWYHLFLTTPGNNPGPVNFYINTLEQTPTSTNGTPPAVWNISPPWLSVGDFWFPSAINTYVGMIMFWPVFEARAPSVTQLYNNGPPTEMLKVGGDAVVSNKLAIGSTNPTEALEVTGNVVVTGSVTATSITGALDAGDVTTGVLPVARGGTGVTTSTGTGSVVLSTSPNFATSIQISQGNYKHFIYSDLNAFFFSPRGDINRYGATILQAGTFGNSTYTCLVGRNQDGGSGVVITGPCLATSFTSTSDDRIKYNEEPVSQCLQSIRKVVPIKYEKYILSGEYGTWMPTDEEWDNHKNAKNHVVEIGIIAQELRKIPELAFLVQGDEVELKKKPISIARYNSLPDSLKGDYTPEYYYYKYSYISVDEWSLLDYKEQLDYTRNEIHNGEYNYTKKIYIDENEYNILSLSEQSVYSRYLRSYYTEIETQVELHLEYDGLFTVGIGAIKELDSVVEEMNIQFQAEKAKVATLEAQMTEVLARLDALTS